MSFKTDNTHTAAEQPPPLQRLRQLAHRARVPQHFVELFDEFRLEIATKNRCVLQHILCNYVDYAPNNPMATVHGEQRHVLLCEPSKRVLALGCEIARKRPDAGWCVGVGVAHRLAVLIQQGGRVGSRDLCYPC